MLEFFSPCEQAEKKKPCREGKSHHEEYRTLEVFHHATGKKQMRLESVRPAKRRQRRTPHTTAAKVS